MRWAQVLWLPFLFTLFIMLIFLELAQNPPVSVGPDRYGENGPDDLWWFSLIMSGELVFVWMALSMWSPYRSIKRIVSTLLFLMLWTMVSGLLSLHGGGVQMIHLLWLLSLVAILSVWLSIRFIELRLAPSSDS